MLRPDRSPLPARTGLAWITVFIFFLSLPGCRQEQRRFSDLQSRYLAQFPPPHFDLSPPLVSPSANERDLNRIHSLLAEAAALRPERLPESERPMYQQFRVRLLRHRDRLLLQRHDPALYNLGGRLKTLLSDTLLQEAERRDSLLYHCLEQAPAYYDSAKAILRRPDPGRTQLAIAKQQKTLQFLEEELPGALPPEARKAMDPLIRRARFAVKDYLAFCESHLFEQQDSVLRRR